MKRFLAGTLGLSLGWLTTHARAEELSWRSVTRPGPAAPAARVAPGTCPAVTLGRPMPLAGEAHPGNQAITDPAFQLASFNAAAPCVVRAQRGETFPEQLPDLLQTPAGPSSAKPLVKTSFACDTPAPRLPASTEECSSPKCCPPTECEGVPCGEEMTCCPCEESSGGGPRFYASAEYLYWWSRGEHVPPLVATGPPTAAGQPVQFGALLFGNSGVDLEGQSGGRVTAGFWLDACRTWAIEGSYFFLGDRTAAFNIDSRSVPTGVLLRPFFNLSSGMGTAELTAQPGTGVGSVSVELPTRLWGTELNVRRNVLCGCDYRVDLLAGFRYLNLEEGLHITERIVSQLTAPPGAPLVFAGDTVVVTDLFDTRNQFYGGQIGADAEFHRGRWFMDVRGKIALGETHQVLDIAGNQVISGPAGVRVFPGGLLAEPNANIGHYSRDRFSIVPEFTLNVGYQITNNLRAFVGYNFLFWSDVLRPADQVDLTVNPNLNPVFCRLNPAQCPTPITTPRPAVPFKTTDFWAQGINLGMEFRY